MANKSRIEQDEAAQAMQPGLFPPGAVPQTAVEACATLGTYSGEGLYRANPGKYREIVRAIASGLGVRATCRAFAVSPHTVAAIREREGSSIATHKEELSRDCYLAARMGVERLIEEMDTLKPESLPVAIGILTDKALLLSGDATSRIERIDGTGAGDFAAAMQAARRARGEVIDVTPRETGLGREDAGTKAIGSSGPAGLVEGDGLADVGGKGEIEGAGDIISRGNTLLLQGCGACGPVAGPVRECAAELVDVDDSSGERGGGGRRFAAGQSASMHPAAENFEQRTNHE